MVVAVLGLGGLAGCGNDDNAADEDPAVCDSVGALKSATADLGDMTVRNDGIGAIQDQLATMEGAYADFREDAADEFGQQVDAVDTDLSTLKDNVAAVVEKPNLTTLGDVGTGVRTLVDDVQTLIDEVESTC